MATRYIFEVEDTVLKANRGELKKFFQDLFGKKDGTKYYENLEFYFLCYALGHDRYEMHSLSSFLKEHGFPYDEDFLKRYRNFIAMELHSEIMRDIVSLCKDLKQARKEVVFTCSGFTKDTLERLKRARLLSYFDLLIGGDMTVKPHRKAYDVAAGKVPFIDCVYIGSHKELDYEIPSFLGMEAYYVGGENKEEIVEKLRRSIK